MDKTISLKGRLKQYAVYSIYLGILLLLVNIAIYLLNVTAGVVLSVFVLFYFVVAIWISTVNRKSIIRELVNFATEYGQVQRTVIKEFDVPYALLEENGRVVWCNDRFQEVLGGTQPRNAMISSLFPEITADSFPTRDMVDSVDVSFTYEQKEYRARISRMIFGAMLDEELELSEHTEAVENAESYLISVFLYDETALKYAIREVDDQSLAICLIYLDNYDEALNSLEEVRRSLLVALIDRKVNKYISAVDGICRKIEKDKYFVILRKKNVKQLQEMRFDLLEDVKTVSIGNEMAVTVSIGVGYDGLSYAQNYEYARMPSIWLWDAEAIRQ